MRHSDGAVGLVPAAHRFFMRGVTITPCMLALLLISGSACAQVWQVDGGEGMLLHRIEQAHAGDRLVLAPGRYRVNLLIDKSLTLEGREGVVLDGGGRGDVIRVHAPDVVIRDMQLVGSGRNLTQMNALVFIERSAHGTRIESNTMHADGFGVWNDGASAISIINNHIIGNPAIRSQDRGNGIHLFNSTRALVEGNEIEKTRDGIYIDTSNHNVLKGNLMHDLRYGIHYMYSYYNQVIGNRTRHTRTGYALMQSKYLTVQGNQSYQDENYGILMNYILYSTIERNKVVGVRPLADSRGSVVMGAEGKAVFIYNSQFNTISDNLFADSRIGIHLTAGSEDNTIYGNAFVRNRVQVKYVATREQEWSHSGKGNYWSDYTGYDMNGDGYGDVAYEPNDGIDRVLWQYPLAKLLLHSPAVETLHWVQRQFPVLRPPGVKDSHPLITLPTIAKGQ